jgi:hypothetical protein
MTVEAATNARLNWDYDSSQPRLHDLYQRAKQAQWSVSDIDWKMAVPFGAPLPDDSLSAMRSFRASPLAPRGRAAWDSFRWELQAWMVSQFLHGEQAALVVAARLIEALPDLDGKFCATMQAVDEARHVEVFSRYVRERIPAPYPVSSPLAELLGHVLADSRWDVVALGMQILVEGIAIAAFRLADSTFHDGLIADITRRVGRDEARHVSFGVLTLDGIYNQMTAAERADREDLVLTAADLTRRRFLLEDIWERLDVDAAEGARFAASDELMIAYRKVIFSRVIVALSRIGLLSDRVRNGLDSMNLLNR